MNVEFQTIKILMNKGSIVQLGFKIGKDNLKFKVSMIRFIYLVK